MTQDNNQITRLLNEAPKAPPSPHLRDQIIATALLDLAPEVPASPQLQQNILGAITGEKTHPASADIINFTPATHRTPIPGWLTGNAFAGGLMAASLILGIWTGANGIADTLISAPLELAGLQVPDIDDSFNYYNVIDGLAPSESSL